MPVNNNTLMYQFFALGVDQNTKVKSLNVNGVLSTIELDFLPTLFSFSVLISIQNAELIDEKAEFKIEINDVDTNSKLFEIGPLTIAKSDLEVLDGSLPEGNVIDSLNASFGIVNLKLTKTGYIRSDVYWNDSLIGSTNILVKSKVTS